MHCVREPFNIGKLIIEKNVIDDSPEYQRESGVWAPEKQQLFLDSIFNGFDIPKIYFHDLRGGKYPLRTSVIISPFFFDDFAFINLSLDNK